MEIKQTITTEVVIFEREPFLAEVRVGLIDGKFNNAVFGYLSKDGKSATPLEWRNDGFHCGDDVEGAEDFFSEITSQFMEHYGLTLPEPVDMVEPVPPTEING